jgi:hypothetical protein
MNAVISLCIKVSEAAQIVAALIAPALSHLTEFLLQLSLIRRFQ